MELQSFVLRVCVLSIVCVGAFDQLMTSDIPPEVTECVQQMVNVTDGRLSTFTADDAYLQCLQIFFWKFGGVELNSMNITEDTEAYMNSLMKSLIGRSRQKRQVSAPVIRREIRMLSDDERNNYHDAINALKSTGEYDRHSNIHRAAINSAHNGPNFLGWHRVYLALYEEALRRINPNVALPYWDSSLDFHMNNAADSILWSEIFAGNGDGFVRTGPFANWRTSTNRRLTRNIGRRSQLISKPAVDAVLTRCRLRDISDPTAADRFSLEMHHNGPHNWVGGQMMSLETSSDDPIFFMHHAYIDYIWELFRLRQVRVCDVNPSTDYPFTTGIQNANRPMVGLQRYRNIDGIRLYWTQFWYRYEYSPTCSPDTPTCNSPYLRCDTRFWRCVSQTRARRFVETPLTVTFSVIATNAGMTFSAANGLRSQTEESMEVDGGPMLRAPSADPRNQPLITVSSRKRRNAIQANAVYNATYIWSLVSDFSNRMYKAPPNDVRIDRNVSSANIVSRDQMLQPRHDNAGLGGKIEFMGTEPTKLVPIPYYHGSN